MRQVTAREVDRDGGSAGSTDDVGSDATEDFIRRNPWLVTFARFGWIAKGVVYLLTGAVAVTVALDPYSDGAESSDGQADPSGAVSKIAQQPFGELLLWAMAVGLFVYALWRIVTVVLPAEINGHSVLRRIGYTASAATYVALGFTAVSLARRPGSSGGGGQESQDSQVTSATRSVMEWTGGRWLVGVAGLVVLGVGCYFAWKAISASFENELVHRSIGPLSWSAVRALGRAGWFGRAVMMWLIGVFVIRAALQYDPDEARGLDDSLRRVADSPLGTAVVYVVAVGLVLYGSFCLITAPARKLVATDEDTVAS
jgi:hypothetical protein